MWSTQRSCDRPAADCDEEFSCVSYADGAGFTRVTLNGELDLATAPKLADALADIPDSTVVVILDLSELTFMDSAGLHVILTARNRLADVGRRLMLVPGGQQVQRVFELTSTKSHLEFIIPPDVENQAIVSPR